VLGQQVRCWVMGCVVAQLLGAWGPVAGQTEGRRAEHAACACACRLPSGNELAESINIPGLVHDLRAQRLGMVQTLDQYGCIYQVVQRSHCAVRHCSRVT
jgi:hypothetical protein